MGTRKSNGSTPPSRGSSPPKARQSAPSIDPEQAVRSSAKRMASGRAEVGDGFSLSPEERLRRISEAAYYRAERRGFSGGNAEQDWIEAEQEIDSELITRA